MRSNWISLVGFFWIAMMAVLLLADARSAPVEAKPLPAPSSATLGTTPGLSPTVAPAAEPKSEPVAEVESEPKQDPAKVTAPYTRYTLTQGLHGFSYGHAAIDLSAGEGAAILAPISGSVTRFFYDELGNPTLIIENEIYQVTLMHGVYTARVGDEVSLGQSIGTESNLGNTVDWWGQSCRGRDCGYHTHLNIFDKRTGSNVNPLELIQ